VVEQERPVSIKQAEADGMPPRARWSRLCYQGCQKRETC